MSSWTCDGVPKDGQTYPQAISGGHSPCENFGPDCMICGLPREALKPGKPGKSTRKTVPITKTTMSTPGKTQKKAAWLIPLMILAGLLLVSGIGWGVYQVFKPTTEINETPTESPSSDNNEFVSATAKNPELFSQGETIFLDSTPEKEKGAEAFTQKDWDSAIAAYEASTTQNDPEGKIYYNNAQARKAGTPLTIAVVVPITNDPNSAKEVLRGVLRYQEEFNQSATGQLLEVVIVDDPGLSKTLDVANDLINASSILGIIGHGIDLSSQQAIKRYEDAGLAIISPLTTSVSDADTLKTVGVDDKSGELLSSYLEAVGKTLVNYANQEHSKPTAIIFYNSDSAYSKQLKEVLIDALPTVQGKSIKEVDTSQGTFDAEKEINEALKEGANVVFLALSKGTDQISQAVAIAEANSQSGSPLLLLGGNELYNPEILIQGDDTINGLVLAVPWSFQPNDPFAEDAVKSWKGRVSWRTATAYDATKVLGETIKENSDRANIVKALNDGVPLSGSTTNFDIFDEVPLVKAVPGSDGPKGSSYQFDPI